MPIDNFGDAYESDVDGYCADVERAKESNSRLINFYSVLYKKFIEAGLYPGCDIYGISDNFDVILHRICGISGFFGITGIRIMYICDDGFCFYDDDLNDTVYKNVSSAAECAKVLRFEAKCENMIGISQVEYDILICYHECDMDRRATACKLSYCVGSIDYHMRKIRDRTGLDPKVYEDLMELIRRCQVKF